MEIHRNQFVFWALLVLSACAPRRLPISVNTCATAPAQLRDAWNKLQEKRLSSGGCTGIAAAECEQLRLEIDRVGQNCPGDQQATLAAAILA